MSLKQTHNSNIQPGDDFYRYVNEQWLIDHPIPAEKSHIGVFSMMSDDNLDRLKAQMEAPSILGEADAIRKVKAFYRAAMDETTIERDGVEPVLSVFDEIAGLHNALDLKAYITNWHARGMELVWQTYLDIDDKDSSIYTMRISQSGLGLPDRDYYFKTSDEFVRVQEYYREFLTDFFRLLGHERAEEKARQVYELEKKMAKRSDTALERRDVIANYNRYNLDRLKKQWPEFDWESYLTTVGVSNEKPILVSQPTFLTAALELINTESIGIWQSYCTVHLLLHVLPALPKVYAQLYFNFYGKILAGSEKQEVRYRRIINTCIGVLPEATGQIFVQSYFDKTAKSKIYELVDRIIEAFRARIVNLSWMTDQTKQRAFEKLDTFLPLLGYPDKWRPVERLNIADSYVKNLLAVHEDDWQYDVSRLLKPVNRYEWLMSPALVNASYWPNTNSITFPAGILQSPLFDADGDFAANFGGIGAVIGHEITHGFDDKGALFDENGRLESWWTDSDWKAFNQKTTELVRQYSQYTLEDQHLNGELTLGENIADLAGILIAYDALQKTLENTQDRALIDGFTPEQRFFMAYATTWRENMRPELALHLMVFNPHSPSNYRVNGVLPNVDAFYDAFSVKPGDGLYLSPEKRVRIW